MVARRVGEKNTEAASTAGMYAIFISLLVTVAVSIPGFIYAAGILRALAQKKRR